MCPKIDEVIVHIGHTKTGTTTLQNTLTSNRKIMRERGILLPDTFQDSGNAALLGFFITDPDVLDRHRREWMKLEREEALHLAEKQWAKILSDISKSNAHKLIISSEHFFVPFCDDTLLRLKTLLASIARQIRIVAYVRSPGPAALSSRQERLKNASSDISRIIPQDHLQNILKPWRKYFSDGLELRTFEKTQLLGGDIVEDFFSAYLPEIDKQTLIMEARSLNVSMSAEAMAIIHDMRSGRADKQYLGQTDISLVRGEDPWVSNATRPKLSREAHQSLTNWFASDILWLKSEYNIKFHDIDYGKIVADKYENKFVEPARIEDICDVNAERKEAMWRRIRFKSQFPKLIRRWMARW